MEKHSIIVEKKLILSSNYFDWIILPSKIKLSNMHLKTEDLTRLEIEFDSGSIPPPYSHTFKLRISFEKNFLNTQLDLHYTGREDLEDEEILEEGFSLSDDYSFLGEIPKVWETPFKDLYSESKWTSKKFDDQEGGVKILAKDIHGKISRTIPINQNDWQLLAQDYLQAIYEISKKEAPLSIKFYAQDQNGIHDISFTVKFSIRKIEALTDGKSKEADWVETKTLLANIFLPDYDYSQAKTSKPTKRGYYIECGDGYWHELGKGVVNIDNSFDAVAKIKEGFLKMLE